MTDHAFAPGTTDFDVRAQSFLRLRPNTTLMQDDAARSIQDFIGRLEGNATLPVPIGNLVVATHANAFGWMAINADNKARGQGGTWYEVAEEVDANNSIEVDERLLKASTSAPVEPRTLRILGCNVGTAEPFLDKLSDALGPNVNVRAPRHLNVLVRRGHGIFEHLNHAFSVALIDPAPTRAALVAAFQASGQTFQDGMAVPNDLFEQCIPRRLGRILGQRGEVASSDARGLPPLGRRIGNEARLKSGVRLKHSPDGFTNTVTYPVGRTPPADEPTRLADLERFFGQSPRFGASHPFPTFRRYGFADLPSFMKGFRWRFEVKGQRLTFAASRHLYRLSVPLVDRATGRLLFNYHPHRGASIETLPEGDAQLFYASR